MTKNNYCIIMAGGVGSRFWPFSREEKPKQFLDFFGTGRSLIQSTFDRFRKIIPVENIFIVTNEAYASLTHEQLPELAESQILLEPMRRNTAPCIAFATYHIKAINPDANIVVSPADHLILKEDVYIAEIQKGLNFVATNEVLLTLGIKPSRPETGYGYIQINNESKKGIHKVKTFTEKPDRELAEVFCESGEFVWNSGIFLWSAKSIMSAFTKFLPDIVAKFNEGIDFFNTPAEKKFINESFPFCQNISIDYGIMEKADNVYVIETDFGWSDLGTWGSLHEVSQRDASNNASINCNALYIESYDNIIAMNNKDKLVVVQGLEDYIIAESDNALLICKKSEEQRIKNFVTDVKFRFSDKYI